MIQSHCSVLYYLECTTGGQSINLSVSSISPDSTSQSLNQAFCTTSPFIQLIELSLARQFSESATIFLNGVSPEPEERWTTCRSLAAESIGWRLRVACPILSSALNRSLSNTSCEKRNLVKCHRNMHLLTKSLAAPSYFCQVNILCHRNYALCFHLS